MTTDSFRHAERIEASPARILGDSSSLRSSDYTLMNSSKVVLSEANDKRMLAEPFKICVNLSHLCYLCAIQTAR